MQEQGPGSNHERAAGPRERLAEGFDGARLGPSGDRVVKEIMDEGGVNHAIRVGCSTPQAVQFFERTAMRLGPCCGKGRSTRIRASKAEHLMARFSEF